MAQPSPAVRLALACDLRVAGPLATFFHCQRSHWDSVLPAGGSSRLPKIIGASRAKAVILGQQEIDAKSALTWGLVNRLVDDPHQNAKAWATQFLNLIWMPSDWQNRSLTAHHSTKERVNEALLYAKSASLVIV